MKVFISWSGDASKAIAELLRGWIPSVIQAAKPYFSPDDISKGSRWNPDIAKELQDCSVGLICLTSENLEAPWIMFEAGALSKSISLSQVCPLLFGIEPTDIKGPLVQFQAAPFTKNEMKKVIQMINNTLGEESLEPEVLVSVFEMWWPKLEEKVNSVLADLQNPGRIQVRSERDILEEILARVRSTSHVEKARFSYDQEFLMLRKVVKLIIAEIDSDSDPKVIKNLLWQMDEVINNFGINPHPASINERGDLVFSNRIEYDNYLKEKYFREKNMRADNMDKLAQN